MKVLVVHNRYREPGGEDAVVRAETNMLRSAGVEIETLEFSNDVESQGGRAQELKLLLQSAWSSSSARYLRERIADVRPDLMHVHNFWIEASPSVHREASAMGVATVQTLHNFRLLCTNAQLLRNGVVCEDCVGKIPWRGVVRKCYRDSIVASSAASAMITANRWRGTWDRDVDAFIALTPQAKGKFIAGGLPSDRIFVKPNFGRSPSLDSSRPSLSKTFLYLGRLSPEKGVSVLLDAWKIGNFNGRATLRIVGGGPDREVLQKQAATLGFGAPGVEFGGFIARDRVAEQIERSRCLLVPSIWYEGFPVTILEAAAQARPTIVSEIGALKDLIRDGVTGFTFPAGDAPALANAIGRVAENDDLVDRLGAGARENYQEFYTPAQNLPRLMDIYRFAVERKRHMREGGTPPRPPSEQVSSFR